MNLKTVACLIVVDSYKEEAKIACMFLISTDMQLMQNMEISDDGNITKNKQINMNKHALRIKQMAYYVKIECMMQ